MCHTALQVAKLSFFFIRDVRLYSITEHFYSHINKMSTMEDFIKPYVLKPEPDPERVEKEDNEPAEQRLHMDVLQWYVTVLCYK